MGSDFAAQRRKKAAEKFKKGNGLTEAHDHAEDYTVATEKINVDDKLKILDELGRKDLVGIFKDWQPRQKKRKPKGAPLDQRVSITVTGIERASLDMELKQVKSSGEKITMSQFIRNRALGSVDINGWRERAEKAIVEIEDIAKNQNELRKQKRNYAAELDAAEDTEAEIFEKKIMDIDIKLRKISAQNVKRNNRLSGRMSMAESETIKWRAQRLCLSSSDYLRMMIFGLVPDSDGDSHMSLDAKRRFYVSVIDVAENGWGNPPEIYECAQCVNYMEEIRKLKEEIRQLRAFA